MPMHDWKRVEPVIFNAFRFGWITELARALNRGLLPPDHYALCETQRCTVYRSAAAGDEVVALLEVVSPDTKATKHSFRDFVERACDRLGQQTHMLVVDLLPPGPFDPCGMHAAIWTEIAGAGCTVPENKLLTLVAYECGAVVSAYLQPVVVNDELTDMPLFLAPQRYTTVPLEATYEAAFAGLPSRWRDVLVK